jgi:hypothetical protein
MTRLAWPPETAGDASGDARFAHPGTNLVLDLHGDPVRAQLAVFSDGNHHMALLDALAEFARLHPEAGEPFYATTPPRVIAEWATLGALSIGNLRLSVQAHVFLGPPAVLQRLHAAGRIGTHAAVSRNRGAVLLVARGNPKGLRGFADLARPDVRVFLSNPETEKVSFDAYVETLARVAARAGVVPDFLVPGGPPWRHPRLVLGESIHHREAPQAVADGAADCAVVFAHLGLRYVRIFPEHFETVALGHEDAHVRGDTHIALVGDGGAFGASFASFMRQPAAAGIYRHHGLEPLT